MISILNDCIFNYNVYGLTNNFSDLTLKVKKILITGGSSFVGRNLIPILAKKYKIYSTFRNNKILFKNKNVINLKIDFKKKFILPKIYLL